MLHTYNLFKKFQMQECGLSFQNQVHALVKANSILHTLTDSSNICPANCQIS
jgi:hypothetical protein